MWSLTRPDAPPDEPVLVVDDRVTGATPDVLEAGARLGMPRREAEALAAFAVVLTRDIGDETRRFETVAAAIADLTPRVEVASPGLALAPAAGAARFYGGEKPLVERVAEEMGELTGDLRGGEALIGIADGPFAARWAAAAAAVGEPRVVSDTMAFLSGLDLSALREVVGGDEMIDTFRRLGFSTLGDLARLPRSALASRFGAPAVLAHRLACGEDRPVHPREAPPEPGAEMSFEDPLESLEAAVSAGRLLSERLLSGLRAVGAAPHAATITAQAASGPPLTRVWRSADPLTEEDLTDRVLWQVRAWVEAGGVPGGITGLSLIPSDLSDEGRQLSLSGDEASAVEAERALARAQALVGPDGVLRGGAQGGRMPAERVTWSRWGELETARERDVEAPWPGALPAPSPALAPPRLERVGLEWDGEAPSRLRLGSCWSPVLTWGGPWRLTGRWWQGEGDVDRYQIVTSAGAYLCVVVEGGAYLAGVYD